MVKYKIGTFCRLKDGSNRWVYSCTCGAVKLFSSYTEEYVCKKCGNDKFIETNIDDKQVIPYLEVISKSTKGFKVKRTNLTVLVDEKYNIKTKRNMVQVLEYDLVNKNIKLFKNGRQVFSGMPDGEYYNAYQRFFVNVDDKEFLKLISVEGLESLYEFAYHQLGYGNWYSHTKKIHRGLANILDKKYEYLEILSKAGFEYLNRFKNVYIHNYHSSKPVINKEGKNPKEILGLPKSLLKFIKENDEINTYHIKDLQIALGKIGVNKLKELLEIARDESTVMNLCAILDIVIELHEKYGYNNFRKLVLYLLREIRITQGITNPSSGATLLRDYVNMCTMLEQDYEKYPKSLKKEHDIAQMNYRIRRNEIKQEEFRMIVSLEDYKELEYKNNKYTIISPNEIDDLIREGNELSHCVASYADSIIENKCKIYFMRKAEDINTPFATIEVRNGNVRQARGYANRSLTNNEKEFIKEWAKEKGLVLNYYY